MEELIRNASIEDFKRGYVWNCKNAQFICLICGQNIGDNDTDANAHIIKHGSPIERLLLLDKKYTGLTEIQKEFLTMISNKYTDKEIASKLACAESTVRNMRFALRERARQARAFLAVMELVEEEKPTAVQPPKLRVFPAREGKRKALLPRFAALFEPNREYTEIEMGIIKIHNKVTGYSFVGICKNLYKPFEGIKFRLGTGTCKPKKMQEDWNTYAEDSFTFEVVEKLKPKEGATEKEKVDELNELMKMWIDSQGENLKLY